MNFDWSEEGYAHTIVQLREFLGISKAELARALGIQGKNGSHYVWRWENRQRRPGVDYCARMEKLINQGEKK